jgi:chaperonin GroEL
LCYEGKISSMKDLLPLLDQVAVSKNPLLIVADDVEGETLATIALNRQKGTLDCLAVKTPGFGDRRKAILQDIAVVTASTAISISSGRELANVTLPDLGRATKVIVTREETTILGGAGESDVAKHAEAIRGEIARRKVPYEIAKLKERLTALSGRIAAVRIGGISLQETTDATYTVESAINSVQKAKEEGCLVGGGVSLLHAEKAVRQLSLKKAGEIAGVNVIADSLEEPVRQLLLNSKKNPAETLRKVRRAKAREAGFNPETGKVQDLLSVGVLDPVATVTRSIQLAFSHARTILETAAWDSTPPQRAKSDRSITGNASESLSPF